MICCLFQSQSELYHPVVVLALVASIVLAYMVLSLIPRKRVEHETAVMEKACGRMEDTVSPSYSYWLLLAEFRLGIHVRDTKKDFPFVARIRSLLAGYYTHANFIIIDHVLGSRKRMHARIVQDLIL